MNLRKEWTRGYGVFALLTLSVAGLVTLAACSGIPGGGSPISGSGGGGGSVNNTLAVAVNLGPNGNDINILFASVVVCVPGTSSCQTIPNVLVDTGSNGLRLIGSQVTLSLPVSTDDSGNPLGECQQFADTSFVWGSVNTADITLAGEVASSVPIQIISPSGFPLSSSASGCNTGGTERNTQALLGANGILGVGLLVQDCGNACATAPPPTNGYFTCIAQICNPATVALTSQVQNPVALFPQDNNGVLIKLPTVPSSGAATLSGSLIFGIGTQSNNALGTAKVYPTTPGGDFTVTYQSTAYTQSFIDSGSNAFFFLDTPGSGLPTCAINAAFYCPAAASMFTVTASAGTSSSMVTFSIDNAQTLLNANPTFSAFINIGGPFAGAFDLGLPFFYGRPVFTAINGKTASGTMGPYWAF